MRLIHVLSAKQERSRRRTLHYINTSSTSSQQSLDLFTLRSLRPCGFFQIEVVHQTLTHFKFTSSSTRKYQRRCVIEQNSLQLHEQYETAYEQSLPLLNLDTSRDSLLLNQKLNYR